VTRPRRRARVYVDGFNFYYAAFREGRLGQYRWLDPVAFSQHLMPDCQIDHVRYFTAKVKPTPGDPTNHLRQGAYLNALKTLDRLTVHFGSFARHQVPMQLVPRPKNNANEAYVYRPSVRDGRTKALVFKIEEKGSDVNLASYLLRDGFKGLYDIAVVVSDDSDLLVPVDMVRSELRREVVVARVPRYTHVGGKRLERASVFEGKASFIRDVRRHHFAASQLPREIATRDGRIVRKPPEWDTR